MLRRTIVALARSPFTVYISATKKHPRLQGLPFRQRGKTLGKMWNALSTAEKAKYQAIAKKLPQTKRRVRKARKPSPMAVFMKKNYKRATGRTPQAKFRSIVRLFKKEYKAKK